MDFLNHRERGVVLYQFFLLSPQQCIYVSFFSSFLLYSVQQGTIETVGRFPFSRQVSLSVGRFPCQSAGFLVSRQVSFSVGRFPCQSAGFLVLVGRFPCQSAGFLARSKT